MDIKGMVGRNLIQKKITTGGGGRRMKKKGRQAWAQQRLAGRRRGGGKHPRAGRGINIVGGWTIRGAPGSGQTEKRTTSRERKGLRQTGIQPLGKENQSRNQRETWGPPQGEQQRKNFRSGKKKKNTDLGKFVNEKTGKEKFQAEVGGGKG